MKVFHNIVSHTKKKFEIETINLQVSKDFNTCLETKAKEMGLTKEELIKRVMSNYINIGE